MVSGSHRADEDCITLIVIGANLVDACFYFRHPFFDR